MPTTQAQVDAARAEFISTGGTKRTGTAQLQAANDAAGQATVAHNTAVANYDSLTSQPNAPQAQVDAAAAAVQTTEAARILACLAAIAMQTTVAGAPAAYLAAKSAYLTLVASVCAGT
jgi:hypothetical protein